MVVIDLNARHAEPEPGPKKHYRYELIHFDDLRPGRTSPYLIDGVIPESGLVAAWGPPKCGKSFYIFDLVMHIACGWPYRGHRVVRGPVVYCAFEGAEGFRARAEAFRRTHEIKDKPWFFLLASSAKLVRDHKALIEAIDGQTIIDRSAYGYPPIPAPPTCVVLDTLNRSIDGSESKDVDMGAYLAAADAIVDAFWCAVIIVHHCGVDGTRPRGHTALTGSVVTQIAVRRDASRNVVAEIEAMRDGPEGEIFTSELKSVEVGTSVDGKPITSCAIIEVKAPPAGTGKKGPRLTADQNRFLDIINDAVLDAPPEHKSTIGKSVAISREWLKQYCLSKGWFDEADSENTRRAKVSNFINKLAGKRVVGANKLYVWPAR